MTRHDDDRARNRDDQMRPGSPPRSAYQPAGAEASSRTSKTRTDPVTGEPRRESPVPARSASDDIAPHPRN